MKKSVIIGVLVCVAFLFLVTLVNGQYDPLLWRYEVFAPNVRSAVCNDNSAYKYYFQPYQEESDKDNWLIYFGVCVYSIYFFIFIIRFCYLV